MDPLILDSNFKKYGIIDKFDSLIWTDRYFGAGDFEITTPISLEVIRFMVNPTYLNLKESDRTMVVESLNIHTDPEAGNSLIVKGRSLETILERRIVWDQTVLTNFNFQDGVAKLLNENAINPTNPDRKLTRLEFVPSTDPAITSLTINRQFRGEYLYDAILDLCLSKNVGFKIVLSDSGKHVFSLYVGKDRSYSQTVNPYVIFSPKFDNVIKGDYTETNQFVKTVSLVAGEQGIGNERKTRVANSQNGSGSDLLRREMYTDGSSLSRNIPGEDRKLTDEEYFYQLEQKGLEDLSKKVLIKIFEGQIDATKMFRYARDFSMGDIVQVVNEFGNEAKSRVTELIHSKDPAGTKIYPTFSAVS